MIENHPFEAFVPEKSRCLILGSFPGRESTQNRRDNDWFYGANRNQFWKILEIVYQKELQNVSDKKALFSTYGVAITDIIKSCERSNDSNADTDLKNITYNVDVIADILLKNQIEKIFFTSKWVAKEFETKIEPLLNSNGYSKIVLPSPSPIFRILNIQQKAEVYKREFPNLSLGFIDQITDAGGITIIKKSDS
jgi:hypoxanthine-DNA glycosylase